MSTRGRKPQLKAIEGGLSGCPPVPAWIPPELAGEWNTIAADMVARKILSASSIGLLESYLMARWSAIEAQKAIASTGVMVAGANGSLKPNPACGMLTKALANIARLAGELGISPASRSKKEFQSKGGSAHDGAPAGLDI